MSKKINLIYVGLLALVLSACHVVPVKAPQQFDMPLLPPALSAHIGVVKQKMTMVAGNKTQTFIVVSSATPQQFEVLVMMPTGQTVMGMTFDGQVFSEENNTGLMLPAKEIMAIMQFASWPKKVINDFYTVEDGWAVSLEAEFRRLDYQQQAFLEIGYLKHGTILINNQKSHYQATIQPLELD